ncbi:MAG: aspartyl/asparaginyl beta-hydroxylase domain-containing protein [Chitinophagales bacterium]|nr:aspartyl/asparaginyl beta-hydroxylase domain-containing protein [Chitinophagales bacterium]
MSAKLKFIHSDFTVFQSNDPVYYNPSDYPSIDFVIDNYELIRNEADDYINRKIDIAYKNPAAPNMTYPDSWKNIYFKNYLLEYKLGKKYFPKTFALMSARRDITLAGITMLAPNSRLMRHCGETNGIIRCHMGLKVPGKLPDIGFQVLDQSVSWEEGKVFAFNDAFQHEAWNNTDDFRYVLVFDVVRPEFAHLRTWICARCLGIEAVRLILGKLKIYNHTPIWIRAIASWLAALPVWVYLKITGA